MTLKKGAVPESLPPEVEARVLEFARTCRAAARAVSLYPDGHSAIQAALERLVQMSEKIAKPGALPLEVDTDTLLVEGRAPSRADAAIVDLAKLLHQHRIARFILHGGTDSRSWRSLLLLLLAKDPLELKDDGGIALMWGMSGGRSIEIEEIDYTALLRERFGGIRPSSMKCSGGARLMRQPPFSVNRRSTH